MKEKYLLDVEEFLRRTFTKEISGVAVVDKEDLELANHLSGLKRRYMKVSFLTVQALLSVRGKLMGKIKKNRRRLGIEETYADFGVEATEAEGTTESTASGKDFADFIYDIREYDVTYYQRVAIDLGFRVGYWYDVSLDSGVLRMECRRDILDRARVKVMAFDIETTHAPMRFPDSEVDCISMMSYMIDQQGYLIVNREIVSEDIHDFEYTPKPEFYGPFRIFNELNEAAVLRRFFDHARAERPHIYVSFNGDTFDWPFVDARARFHGMSLADELGLHGDKNEEFTCHYASHLDCFKWVVRDSYLPAGSQGLKAVTKAKLGYDPLELDPEDMVKFATERPQTLASYSVSDAVATYYLYQNYVHPFIFSLCTIIPMHPDDVLRKGSGTLCEALLQVQATSANVIYPNKSAQDPTKLHDGHLIESETYIGGHVESLAAGVFRSDIPMRFQLDVATIDMLLAQLDDTLKFAINTDGKGKLEDVANYDEVRNQVAHKLQSLHDDPDREDKPLIYHLDVGAMYPNIILTNRLQPSAIVDELTCAACDFNKPENKCQRRLNWTWRGELFPANMAEFELVRSQLESEKFPSPYSPDKTVSFFQLPPATQQMKLKQRIKDYCKRVYKKTHVTVTEEREDTVCMRENSFYIDTVRLFRDRRYEYKAEWTLWKSRLTKAQTDNDPAGIIKAKEMVVIYESLQIAHKCILNSFYGYVMRRGARWFSMKMAGMVTKTGAAIIQRTRELVERVGIPLELDTDGIWCVLPSTFPENLKITWKDASRRPFTFSYTCEVLNHMVNREFTNDQYQILTDPARKLYEIRSENSIFFEVDGPYRAMILPASSEEGKTLKKRYAVFRLDGSLAELKGFELKRRGELNLVKIFQGKIFEVFLQGATLEDTYREVAKVADRWLDILFNKGQDMEDEELIDLLSSSSSMSKALSEYGESKSNAITTAKRLGEFLGPQMVANKGLACKYLISREPQSAPVTERAIPVIIFSADRNTRNYFLRKWTRDTSKGTGDYGIRDILDWDYYISRFGKTLQKIITIPAAMQGVRNPLPRVADPDWLRVKKQRESDPRKQRKIDSIFVSTGTHSSTRHHGNVPDIESMALALRTPSKRRAERDEEIVTPFELAARRADGSSHKHQNTVTHEEEAHATEERSVSVSRQDDYNGWLRNVKKQWRARLAERKKRVALSPAPMFLIRNYEDRGRFRFALRTWQVLQVVESPRPGEFDVWVVMQGEGMRKLKLFCDRNILINSVVPDADQPGKFPWKTKRVSLMLPHSKPALNLYEIEMPEATFQRSFRELSTAFTSADVEGVYETKTSLVFNLLQHMGVCCDVDAVALKQEADNLPMDAFHAKLLQRRPVSREHPYLSPESLETVFLYHSCLRDQSRGMFGVFLPESSNQIHVVLYSSQRSDVSKIEDYLQSKFSGRSISVKKVSRRDLACKLVDKIMKGHHALSYTVPTLISIQTTVPDSQLMLEVPSLEDFPTVRLIPNEQDNQYDRSTNWELYATNCFVQRQAHVQEWLARQLAFSAYAELPLANFRLEHPAFVSDIFFQRTLRRHGMVTWASDNNRPDLGGAEEDNNIILVDLENPELSFPGCYDTVCIELNVFNLAINSILQSHLVNVAEGGPTLSSTASTTSKAGEAPSAEAKAAEFDTFDDTSDCVPAFRVLRALVHQWTLDMGTVDDHNEWAEVLLNHVYHWISSPQSKTYDPALHRLVHLLMRKVFLQLVHELKSLGAKIVYATFNQIVIATNKKTLDDARTYWDFVHKTLFSNELFAWLTVEPSTYWDVFLFLDVSNFGGITATEEVTDEPPIVSNWNLAEYLSPPVDQSFIITVSEYLMNVWTMSRSATTEEVATLGGEEERPLKQKKRAVKGLITSELTQRLFQAVSLLNKNAALYKATNATSNNKKALPDADTVSSNLALQFISTVCHVLGVDKDNVQGVHILKRDLLKLINVDVFAPESNFHDPAPSYVLQDVICEFCMHPHNMDLLRDPQLLNHSWECAFCGHLYNKLNIESLLVQRLYQHSYAFQAQDLICQKCKLVKAENLSDICPTCSGTYVCRVSPAEMKSKLETFTKIATFHSMAWLQGVIEQMKMFM